MNLQIDIIVMSGVYDGEVYTFGFDEPNRAVITFGREENNNVHIATDATISRNHATITYREGLWWLEDLESKNGTFIEHHTMPGRDIPVYGTVQLTADQLFRIGKTWFRFQPYEWHATAR
ncbi:MAG: FHA domain-containing protein [Chloroflexota bacterium]